LYINGIENETGTVNGGTNRRYWQKTKTGLKSDKLSTNRMIET